MCKGKGVDFYIGRAKQVHGGRYDYSRVSMRVASEKVEIVCKEHGSFFQSMSNHIHNKRGCPKCGARSAGEKLSFSVSKWLERFKEVHGDEFIYPEYFDTTNQKSVIDITCKVHGVFRQAIFSHSSGTKCPECQKAFMGGFYRKDIPDEEANNIYLLSFVYNGSVIHKVGVTKGIDKRLKLLYSEVGVMPDVLLIIPSTTNKCLAIERSIKLKYKHLRAVFDTKFGGFTECYVLNNEQVDELRSELIASFN